MADNRLKWVYGNRLMLAIPMQIVTMTKEGKVTEDYVPQEGTEINVVLSSMVRKYTYTPVVSGNVLVVDDNAGLDIGAYNVTVIVTEPDGTKRRSHWNKVVEIYHDNAEVLDEFDDFPDYAEGQVIEGSVFFFAKGEGGTNDYNDLINKPDLSIYTTTEWVEEQDYLTDETDPTVPAWAKQPTKPSYTASEVGALPSSTEIPSKTSDLVNDSGFLTQHQDISGKADKSAAIGSLSLSLDSTNYKITLSGTKVDGTSFTVSNVIDLPIESVVVGGSYDSTNKKVVLTLQNDNTVEFSVADLVTGLQSEITVSNKLSADLISDGNTNKVVTETEKTTWNSKVSNVQADWNASSGLAQILNKPTNVSSFTNDAGYLTQHQDISGKANSADLATVATSGSYNDLTNKPTIPTVPTNVSAFTNDANYLTSHQDISGKENRMIVVSASQTTISAAANTYYRFDNAVTSLVVTLPEMTDTEHTASVILNFTTGETPLVYINTLGNVPVAYYDGYSIEASTSYELNIMYNGSKWIVAYGIIEQA